MPMKAVYELKDKLGFGKKMLGDRCVKEMTIKEILDYGRDGYGYIAWCFNDVAGFTLSPSAFSYAKKKEAEVISNTINRAKNACKYDSMKKFPTVPIGEYAQLEHDLRGDMPVDIEMGFVDDEDLPF